MKKIIINGQIICHDKTIQDCDILIEDGIITAITENIDRTGAEIIDAENMFILPGSVDMFTKLAIDGENKFSAKAFKQNSLSALYGGTTTVIEDLSLEDNKNSDELINFAKNELKDNACTDYSFHRPYTGKISQDEIEGKITSGLPSYSVSMAGENKLSDEELLELLCQCTPYGGISFVHAESQAPITLMQDLHKIKKRTMPYAIATSRPSYTETEALTRLSNLSRAGNVSLAVNAVSTKESVQMLRAQVSEGLPITILTNPHYLVFTEDKYLTNKDFDEEAYKYIVNPPLRKKEDVNVLWKAIDNGLIQCLTSAHTGVNLAHKLKLKEDIFNVPTGVPSIELKLSLLHTYGVLTNKISMNKMVEITATHVTRIAGLRTKGRIEAGTDADIVIFDPNKKKTITKADLHDACDYSPYEGLELQGFAKHVFLGGKQVIKDFNAITTEANGKYYLRKAVAMR